MCNGSEARNVCKPFASIVVDFLCNLLNVLESAVCQNVINVTISIKERARRFYILCNKNRNYKKNLSYTSSTQSRSKSQVFIQIPQNVLFLH